MRLGRKSKPRKQPTRNPPATGGLRRPANESKSILSAPREEICTLTRIPYFNKTRRANSNKISLRFNPPRWQGLQTMGQPISGAPRPFSDHSPRSLRQATRKRIRKHSERVSSKNIFLARREWSPGRLPVQSAGVDERVKCTWQSLSPQAPAKCDSRHVALCPAETNPWPNHKRAGFFSGSTSPCRFVPEIMDTAGASV